MATIRSPISPTENRVLGKAEYEYVWHKLRWRFASGEHRDLFIKDPQRYAPQYDGYCAMGASFDASAHKDTVDPEAWAIVDGKLYLVHNSYWLEKWREKAKEHIKQADKDWRLSRLRTRDVDALCASRRLRPMGGKRLLAIGAQVPRDEAGKSSERAICGRRSSKLVKTLVVPQGRGRNCQRHCLYG